MRLSGGQGLDLRIAVTMDDTPPVASPTKNHCYPQFLSSAFGLAADPSLDELLSDQISKIAVHITADDLVATRSCLVGRTSPVESLRNFVPAALNHTPMPTTECDLIGMRPKCLEVVGTTLRK